MDFKSIAYCRWATAPYKVLCVIQYFFVKICNSTIGLSPMGTRVGFVYASTSNSLFLPLSRWLILSNQCLPCYFIFAVLLRVFLFGRPHRIWTSSAPYNGSCSADLSYRWTKLCYISIQPLYRWLFSYLPFTVSLSLYIVAYLIWLYTHY